LDRSAIAQHNSAEQGYWVIIEGGVYDLTRFVEDHPGGRRVIQLYAGTDATHGFARAHPGRPDVNVLRERHRLGVVRALALDDVSASLYRALSRQLNLVVEMQNALAADQSLQREDVTGAGDPGERTPCKLSRGLETHQRFRASYLHGLATELLPDLWSACQGLLFPDAPVDWMRDHLARTAASEPARRSLSLATQLFEHLPAWASDPRLPEVVSALEGADTGCLAAMKAAWIEAVRAFEDDDVPAGNQRASRVRAACEDAGAAMQRYHERLGRELSRALGPSSSAAERDAGRIP